MAPKADGLWSAGAIFLKADLQIHTPVDKRFRLPGKLDPATEEGREKIGRAYIDAATKAGIRVLGITEHNDLTFVPYIQAAASGTDIVVFPGVELTVVPNLHVIGLFEPDADVDHLWDCIVQMGLKRRHDGRFHDDGSPRAYGKQLKEAVKIIEQFGGIVIAPHVCGNSGVLTLPAGQNRIESWTEPGVLAADPGGGKRVESLGSFERGAFENTHDQYRREHPLAPVWTSDARGLEEIGRCATWIKTGAASIEALRQAFLDPESRIRHADDYDIGNYPHVVDIGWDGHGFLGDQTVALNPNLNCLIGGKGAGKSSVVETLRYAFNLPVPAEMRDANRSLLHAVLPSGSSVRVTVETAEPRTRYIIERSQGRLPVVKDGDGEILVDVAPADVQPLSVYGQKEIYAIAQHPSDQLAVLDDFIRDDIDGFNTSEADLLRRLTKNGEAMTTAEDDLVELEERLKSLPRLQAAKKKYETLGIADKLAQKTATAGNLEKLRRARQRLAKFSSALSDVPTMKSEYPKIASSEPLHEYLNAARDLLVTSAGDWQSAVDKTRDAVEQRTKSIDALIMKAKEDAKVVDARFETVAEELAAQFPEVELDAYLQLEEEIESLEPLKDERADHLQRLKQLRTKRAELLQELLNKRKARFQARRKQTQSINAQLQGILKISVAFEGVLEPLREYIDELRLGIKKATLDALFEHEDFTLGSFLGALEQGSASVASAFGITDTVSTKLFEAITVERKRELEALTIPDAIDIKFNVSTADAPQYRELDRLSVGQKSTAVLLLLLLKDDTPFVVDQPEDDLDNRFIYEDVVKRLRASKEKRQFLVATHNANIPVLGDAEQIIVMSASNAIGEISATGSIDDPDIQGHVKHVLEGGQKAFDLRKKKYGF